jgi:ABC-type uncharacterized transport system permease subunit
MHSSLLGAALVLLIIASWALFLTAPQLHRGWIAIVVLGLSVLAGCGHVWQSMLLGFFTAMVVLLPLLDQGMGAWPV